MNKKYCIAGFMSLVLIFAAGILFYSKGSEQGKEGISESQIVETEEPTSGDEQRGEIGNADEIVMEKSINPYFFPEDISTAKYSAKFDFKAGEDGTAGAAELSVSKVNIFRNGILYKWKVQSDTEAFDEKGILIKRDDCLGYFYVEAERIFFIRSNVMKSGVTESELIDMGTVVCQPESWKENRITSGTEGWHGRIEVIDDKCFFWGYNDLERSEYDGCYEYFIWQKGKGLTGYRRGRGENEEMYLYMEGMETEYFAEEERVNPYFFPEGVTTVSYDGYFHFKERNLKEDKLEREVMHSEKITLNIRKERTFEHGILYSMEISDNGAFYFGDNDWGEKNRSYLNLGYFYVQEDKIYKLYLNYFIPEREIEDDITEEELLKSNSARIICQSEPRRTGEGEDVWPRYWYDYVDIIGDRSEFYSEDANTKLFTESFKWQKGLGLVEYRRGSGYDDDDIIIYFN